MKHSIMAGIVTFNPDIQRLEENISSIANQVLKVVVVDNGSSNIAAIQQLIHHFEHVELVLFNENKGIAAALQELLRIATEEKIEWLYTLDQDSVSASNIISVYTDYLNKQRDIDKVGMLQPYIVDRNILTIEAYQQIEKQLPNEVTCCITSGCLQNVQICNKIGGYNADLFIDYVDTDICARLILAGYKIIKLEDTYILHEMGEMTEHHFLGKKIIASNHSAFRKYYIYRNALYYIDAYKDKMDVSKERREIKIWFIVTLLFEKDKVAKIKAMYKGIKDSKTFIKQQKNK